MSAYVYAETMLMGPGGPGSTWLVVALGSLMAPAEQAKAAGATLKHSGESLVMNPAWIAMQNQLNNRAIQQINAATRATIAATNAENAREQAMISAAPERQLQRCHQWRSGNGGHHDRTALHHAARPGRAGNGSTETMEWSSPACRRARGSLR